MLRFFEQVVDTSTNLWHSCPLHSMLLTCPLPHLSPFLGETNSIGSRLPNWHRCEKINPQKDKKLKKKKEKLLSSMTKYRICLLFFIISSLSWAHNGYGRSNGIDCLARYGSCVSVAVKSPIVWFGPVSLPHMSKTTTGQHGAFSGLADCLKAGRPQNRLTGPVVLAHSGANNWAARGHNSNCSFFFFLFIKSPL